MWTPRLASPVGVVVQRCGNKIPPASRSPPETHIMSYHFDFSTDWHCLARCDLPPPPQVWVAPIPSPLPYRIIHNSRHIDVWSKLGDGRPRPKRLGLWNPHVRSSSQLAMWATGAPPNPATLAKPQLGFGNLGWVAPRAVGTVRGSPSPPSRPSQKTCACLTHAQVPFLLLGFDATKGLSYFIK